MDLIEANVKLKKLENEEEYWLNEKELAMSKVLPKGISIEADKIPSTKRVDKNLEYVIELDDKKIDETLDYIHKKKRNLMDYIEKELKIIGQYSILEKRIYELRNDPEYIKTHNNNKMPFNKIGKIVGYSESQCNRIYRKLINRRTDN